jgi:hypothetical protein
MRRLLLGDEHLFCEYAYEYQLSQPLIKMYATNIVDLTRQHLRPHTYRVHGSSAVHVVLLPMPALYLSNARSLASL